MASPKEFAARMNKIAANVEVNTDEIQRRTAIAISQAVIPATPVDTGLARSNWLVGLGKPDRTELEEPVEENVAISRNNAKIGKHRGEKPIYLSNNLNYISFLNAGSSAQAPAMFVEEAVQEGVLAAAKGKVLK